MVWGGAGHSFPERSMVVLVTADGRRVRVVTSVIWSLALDTFLWPESTVPVTGTSARGG